MVVVLLVVVFAAFVFSFAALGFLFFCLPFGAAASSPGPAPERNAPLYLVS